MKKRKVCIVILILAIIALLIGISYLVQASMREDLVE